MRRDDSGFTLVEMVIGTLLASIVGALFFTTLATGQQSERHLIEVSASQEELRRALVEITSDIRSAEPLWFIQASSPAPTPISELRLEHWEPGGSAPTYLRWHVVSTADGDELVRDIVTYDAVTKVVTTVGTTYRLRGIDASLSGFGYQKPKASSPYYEQIPVDVVANVDWQKLNQCTNTVSIELRSAAVGSRHPTSVRSDINLRNQVDLPEYCS